MRTVSRLLLCAVIVLLTAALAAAAIYVPEVFFEFYTDASKGILNFLSGVTAPFPFAVWEVLLALIVLLALYFLARNRKFVSWLAGVALLVCGIAFGFVALWGLNHFAPPISERVGLEVTQYSREQLISATKYMAEQAGHWAEQVERDGDGHLAIDLPTMAKQAGDGYAVLAQTNDFFAGSDAPVKVLLVDEAFSYMGITGIFVPLTGESGINPGTYNASIPFTMCHELAHRLTVAAEDEANFCAFLACKENPDPAFQYSGWYSAFVYTYNALHKVDREAAAEVWASVSETLKEDCRRANTHYDRYEGEVQEAAQKVNDVYLKAFQEESGVQSYGEVADLLIAWYLENAEC